MRDAPPRPSTPAATDDAQASGVAAMRGRVDWMMLFPAVAAAAWFGGRDALAMVLVGVLPVFLALSTARRGPAASPARPAAGSVRRLDRPALVTRVDAVLREGERLGRRTAVLRLGVVDLDFADDEWGSRLADRVMAQVADRVAAVMRGQDEVVRSADDGVTILLAPARRMDLDVAMRIVDRVQSAVAEPVSLDGRAIRVRCCIGLCTEGMAPARDGAALLSAADCALRLAVEAGPDAVRAFNDQMRDRVEIDQRLAAEVVPALESGEIRPWFQPQVDAETGAIIGFEALARWEHPELGVLLPGQFLAAIAAAGKSNLLGEQILYRSLQALTAWDEAGLDRPRIGVNVSLEELRDPRLAERIQWQVDRFDVAPERVALEILETVTLADREETIVRNVRALRKAGFRLDLDDFGVGAASIAHIARFGVHRIKIDRSFVQDIDGDVSRQRVVRAILSLARELEIETLAEGVETEGERDLLASLGCPHVQGFGIARPMPFDRTIPWALSSPGGGSIRLRASAT